MVSSPRYDGPYGLANGLVYIWEGSTLVKSFSPCNGVKTCSVFGEGTSIDCTFGIDVAIAGLLLVLLL